jgi:glycosyltransferase involved in cell wall biosynthesis
LTRILIDGRWICPTQRGIGNFTNNLISHLAENDLRDIRITITSNYKSIKELKKVYNNKFEYLLLPGFPDPILDLFYFNILNLVFKFHVVHFTGNSGLIYFKKKTKVILTLHDVSFMKNYKIVPKPQRLKQLVGRIYRRLFVPLFVRHADYIVTVSKFAKNDIIKEFPLNNNIDYIYHGFNFPNFNELSTSKLDDYEIFKNKFLVISGNDPQKNLHTVINAFSSLYDYNSSDNPVLIIVGVTKKEYVKYNPKVFIKPNIIFYGYINNKNLYYAIIKSNSIIISSYYESFGLPLIEALFLRKKVICSNTGALSEIALNSATYFDPFDVNSLIIAIKNIDNFENDIIENWIIENSSKFLWSNVSSFYLSKYLS